MEKREEEITEEQRNRAEANRAAALAKRKALTTNTTDPWKLFKCRKPSPEPYIPKIPLNPKPEKFLIRFEICSPDSFSVAPVPIEGFPFPGEEFCFHKLSESLHNVMVSHYTQNTGGGKACVYRLYDYHSILRTLKSCRGVECEEIPWGTFNVIERLSHSFIAGKWIPCRPEHLHDEKVEELIGELPKGLVSALLPFQVEGVRFGLRRGGRCLIADEMGLGKTLQAIAIAGCFMKEGSILVVCPAILRYTWAEELERWFPFCSPSDIHLVFGHKDDPARLAKRPRVVVISYTMLRNLKSSMLGQEWVTLIVDESHHLHCSKKLSEKDELQVVLDVANKVKHLILLSGTPSLARPGLLGQTKYEFAKTYCSVKFRQGCQGKVFQDFSKGIRLEELNVLLKQSVMVRRLKEHVLLQLPPKRRQIIKLVLKKSDINFAMETLGLETFDASADSDSENAPLHVSDEDQDSEMNKKLARKLSALGIAKLPGFFEWLCIHPIMAEADGEETTGESSGSHKMIIFAYHHKVLDVVQAFICDKGVQFVRIDCTITGSERQSAIQSFQLSKEVKIALIGIRAGSSGLNLTSADNVVFLELPTRPGDIQQAEDRAHRHGQKRPVNIYIFCAKDTSDESQWRKLNRSLLRVSSTMNGKRDALQELEVEGVSNFETIRNTSEKGKQLMNFQNSCLDHDPQQLKASSDTHIKVDNGSSEQNKSKTTLSGDGCVNEVEDEGNSSILSTALRFEVATIKRTIRPESGRLQHFQTDSIILSKKKWRFSCKLDRFEQVVRFYVDPRINILNVSQHTGRIHLYSCLSGTDSRPRPLFQNFRQEEVESSQSEENEETSALMAFIKEWKSLRPIERRKLINKPLQLPLSYELCYLNESLLNHDYGGLLRGGGSKRRKTPITEISYPLPSNATWKKVNLYGGRGQKEKLYTQGWSDLDEPLCKLCQTPCKGNNAKVPQFFEDLFCGLVCFEEYRSRTSNRFLRESLFQIENGVCTFCQLNCHRLVKHLKPLSLENRREYIKKVAPNIARRAKLLDKLVDEPTDGHAWHADHIVPVYKGGGECKLDNLRTLCVACHADVTTAQCAERRIARKKAKKQLKDTMSNLSNVNKSRKVHVVKDCALDLQQNELEQDLLVEIPGSAYSIPNACKIKDQIGEQELKATYPSESAKAVQIDEINSKVLGNSCNSAELYYNKKEASQVVRDEQGCEEQKKLLNFEHFLYCGRSESLKVSGTEKRDDD